MPKKNPLLPTCLVTGVLLSAVLAAAAQPKPEFRITADSVSAGAPAEPLPETAAEPGSAPGQSARAGSPWGFEVFGRGSWTRVQGREEVSIGLRGGEALESLSAEGDLAAWDLGSGLGVRAVRGRLGIEASWQRIGTEVLRRFAPARGDGETVLDDAGVSPVGTEVDADLFVGQIVFRTSPRGAVSGFVGLGAGWLRVSDPVADEFDAGTLLGEAPAALRSAFETQAESDAGQPVLGGSAGLTIWAGRVLVRPRIEAWVGRELAGNYRIGFAADDPLLPGGVGFDLSSRLRPTLLLFAVDLGLNLR